MMVMDLSYIKIPQSLVPEPVTGSLKDLPVFWYEPLKSKQHIRLLRTRHCQTEQAGSIRCAEPDPIPSLSPRFLPHYEIVQMNMEDLPQYQAISYAWGDSTMTHAMKISGTHHFRITESLAVALPHLTEICSTGLLWIDQICIDQGNVEERNHQVGIMGEIYRNAEEVFIWTGEEINGLQEMKARIPHLWAGPKGIFSKENDEALAQLLRRPWFKRAWVLQEAVLAKKATFVAGSCLIPLSSLDRACSHRHSRWTGEYLIDTHNSLVFFNTIMTLRANDKKPWPWASGFDRLLNRLGITQTSDLRDHVYAFLGLNFDSRVIIVPDYTLSASQVYTTTARAIIEGTNSLDIFRFLTRIDDLEEQLPLPSWVPDWSTHSLESRILQPPHVDSGRFDAARGFRHGVRDIQESQQYELLVSGKIIDSVRLILPGLNSHIHNIIFLQEQPIQRILSLSDEQVAFLGDTVFGDQTQNLRQRILTVLVAGRITPEETLRLYDEVKYKGYDFTGLVNQLVNQLVNLWHYKLVYSERGKVALVPPSVLKGDSIAILHGLDVPAVLRRLDDGTYVVVGQCYREDAMFGEAVSWEEDEADIFTLV